MNHMNFQARDHIFVHTPQTHPINHASHITYTAPHHRSHSSYPRAHRPHMPRYTKDHTPPPTHTSQPIFSQDTPCSTIHTPTYTCATNLMRSKPQTYHNTHSANHRPHMPRHYKTTLHTYHVKQPSLQTSGHKLPDTLQITPHIHKHITDRICPTDHTNPHAP